MRLVIICAAGAVAIAGCAGAIAAPTPNPALPPAPAKGAGLPSGQCFRSHDIRNHTIADRQTLLLSVKRNEVYRVVVAGGCLAGAISSDPIVTRNPPGSEIVCKPIDLDIAIGRHGASFPAQCIVESVDKLSPEQVAALPRKVKP